MQLATVAFGGSGLKSSAGGSANTIPFLLAVLIRPSANRRPSVRSGANGNDYRHALGRAFLRIDAIDQAMPFNQRVDGSIPSGLTNPIEGSGRSSRWRAPAKGTMATVPPSSLWDDDPRAHAAHGIEVARELCSCEYPYHVLWSILRAADITGSLRYQEDEALTPVLRPLLQSGTRVLIAGSADTGTLCVAGRIAGALRPQFTVLDRCPAPLRLIEEFATARQLACRTLRVDLLALDEGARWDVVLVNYTLQYVAAADRGQVLKNLARSLAPGGTLICVAKTGVPLSPSQAADSQSAWLDKARRKFRAAELDLRLAPSEVDEMLIMAAAGRTARRLQLPTEEELVRGLHEAGLVLDREAVSPRKQLLEAEGAPQTDVESSIILAAFRPA
jgi:SAM-dependent methyltransferase